MWDSEAYRNPNVGFYRPVCLLFPLARAMWDSKAYRNPKRFAARAYSDTYNKLKETIRKCKSIKSLSGFLEVGPQCLPSIYPILENLTSLNLSYAPGVHGSELIKLIHQCVKLQRLWILDCIGDKGLGVVASSCKELQELRVFPSDPFAAGHDSVTEEGLVAVSAGCHTQEAITNDNLVHTFVEQFIQQMRITFT